MSRIVLPLLLLTGPVVAAERPNLLFVIADDCTFRDLGCYGGQAHTPNIDRLATEGVRFTRCFQAAPMCSPTRHNVYTGLYPVRSGAYPNHTFVKEGTKSVVQHLQPLGYRVALSGKTHVNPKSVFAFEFSGKGNNPDMEAIDTMFNECREEGTPFCLFACSNEPHSPWNKGDASRYPPEKIELPPYFVDTPETREAMSRYLAEVTYYDGQVGRLLKLLEKHDLADDTLVMVVSEQGSSFAFAKWTLYDSGIQSGMVVRWPGHTKAGTTSEAMVEYVDVLPTFLDAAGAEPVEGLDGRSFVPVLEGRAKEHKTHVFAEMTTRGIINGSDTFGIRSVRSGRYKYILNFTPEIPFRNACTKSREFQSWVARAEAGDEDAADKVRRYTKRPGVELYDVVADPYEWTNLADDPAHADAQADLRRRLDAWMKQQGDLGQATELAAKEHQGAGRRKRPRKPKADR